MKKLSAKMVRYRPAAGEELEEVCANMCRIARDTQCTILGTFNAIELRATPFTREKGLSKKYLKKQKENQLAFKASPEYRERELQDMQARRAAQRKERELIQRLPEILTKKVVAEEEVVRWLDDFVWSEPSRKRCSEAKNIFIAFGFQSVNSGSVLWRDRKKTTKYIVGMIISSIEKLGCISHELVQLPKTWLRIHSKKGE